MKQSLYLLLALTLASCNGIFGEDDESNSYNYDDNNGSVFFNAGDLTLSASGGSKSVTICAPDDWTAYVVYSDGSYGSSSYAEMPSSDSLYSDSTDSDGENSGESDSVTEMTPSTDVDSYLEDGDYTEPDLDPDSWNYDSTVESELDWLTMTVNEGSTNSDVEMLFIANTNSRAVSRTAEIRIVFSDGTSESIYVTQSEGDGDVLTIKQWSTYDGSFKEYEEYSVTFAEIEVGNTGGDISIRLSSNVYTQIEVSCDDGGEWARVPGDSSSLSAATRAYNAPSSINTESYYVEILPYEEYLPRTATVVISAENRTDVVPVIITVTQLGEAVLQSSNEVNYVVVDEAGGEFSVTFDSNMPLEITQMPEWVSEVVVRSTTSRTYNFSATKFDDSTLCGRAGALTFQNSETGASLTYSISQGNAVYNSATSEYSETLLPLLKAVFGETGYKQLTSILIEGSLSQSDLLDLGDLSGDYLESIDLSGATTVGDKIPEQMFLNTSIALESFALPQGVKTIGKYAFSGCEYMKFDIASIAEDIEYIGDYAFNGCSKAYGLPALPETLTYLGERAFYGCSSMAGSITIPNSITKLYAYTFASCSGLTSIALHDNITSLYEGVFSGCTGLSGSITMPPLVTWVNTRLFSNCKLVSEVILHSGIKSIGDYAFYGCESLATIDLPSTLTGIGEYAFSGSDLSQGTITIPGSVETVDYFSFSESNIKNLVLEEGIVTIDTSFYKCANLDGVLTMPSTLRLIDGHSWYNSNNYTTYYFGAFEGCKLLEGVVLNDLLEDIDAYSFADCSSLSGEIVLPSRIESISRATFQNCSSLTSVVLNERLTAINTYAFNGCSKIESFTLPWDDVEDAPRLYSSIFPSNFTSTSSDYVMRVPEGSKSGYEADSSWGNYYFVEY